MSDEMPDTRLADADYKQFVGLKGEPIVSAPLEADALRRFVQAIMDNNPLFYDGNLARESRFGGIAAPPLYPLHAFRRATGTSDPLDSIKKDPNADGTAEMVGMNFGLPPIPVPFKRLLNGGSDVEFYRCLMVGERAVATPQYKSISLKSGKTGDMLVIVREILFTTETDELLIIVRQTALWR